MPTNYEANMDTNMDAARRQNWAGEVTNNPPSSAADWNQPWTMGDTRFPSSMNNMNSMGSMGGGLQMQNNLPSEVIESPTTVNEAYLGSLKATLLRNRGNFIVATFLIGTQNTVSWEGILYEVGNDYVTIYQPGRDRYVVTDMYSLKYMEFYDTRRREMCDELLAQRGMGGSMSSMGNQMGGMNSMGNMGGNMNANMSGGLASGPRGW